MKKFRCLAAFIAALMLCLCVFPQKASALMLYQYSVSASHMNIRANIPETLAVFTRAVKSSDPNLKLTGMTAKEIIAFMKDYDYYLYMVPVDTSKAYDYTVSMFSSDTSKRAKNFASASIHDIVSYMDGIVYTMEQMGVKVNDVTLKTVEPYLYIWISSTIPLKDNKEVASDFYWTVYNSESMRVMLTSYDGPITDAMHKEQEAIVESIVYTKQASSKKKSKSSSGGNTQRASFPMPGLPLTALS